MDGFQLRGKYNARWDLGHVERLFSHAISSQMEDAGVPIPESHRKHSVAALKSGLEAPALDGAQQYFGVTAALKTIAEVHQLLAQCSEIVYFAVKSDDEPSSGRMHRLVSGVGQVNNGKTAMPQRNASFAIAPESFTVWAAVAHSICHPDNRTRVSRAAIALRRQDTCDAAHLISSCLAPAIKEAERTP